MVQDWWYGSPLMKTTHKNALEIANQGGAIASGDWTTGTGRFISKRPIPEFCKEITTAEVKTLKGKSKVAATKLLKARPKIAKLIVVHDWRSLGRVVKKETTLA